MISKMLVVLLMLACSGSDENANGQRIVAPEEARMDALYAAWRTGPPAARTDAASAILRMAEKEIDAGKLEGAAGHADDIFQSSAPPEVRARAFSMWVRASGDAALPRIRELVASGDELDVLGPTLSDLLGTMEGDEAASLRMAWEARLGPR